MAKYLKEDLSNELNNSQALPDLETANEQHNLDERYVWPWKGIVPNIFRKPKNEPGNYDSEHWQRESLNGINPNKLVCCTVQVILEDMLC